MFHPRGMTAEALTEGCFRLRREFNRYSSIAPARAGTANQLPHALPPVGLPGGQPDFARGDLQEAGAGAGPIPREAYETHLDLSCDGALRG